MLNARKMVKLRKSLHCLYIHRIVINTNFRVLCAHMLEGLVLQESTAQHVIMTNSESNMILDFVLFSSHPG